MTMISGCIKSIIVASAKIRKPKAYKTRKIEKPKIEMKSNVVYVKKKM